MLILVPNLVFAKSGCCSHHGGVAGCNSSGRQVCNDGTLSPSCTCTPTVTYVYGCTDNSAKNYNSAANKDDGSCEYYKYGCTNSEAINYDESADSDDGSCKFTVATFNENKDNASVINSSEEKNNDKNSFLLLLLLVGSGYGIYKLVNKN